MLFDCLFVIAIVVRFLSCVVNERFNDPIVNN